MRVRRLRLSDVPTLQRWAEESGFPYPEWVSCEAVHVVVDEQDRPLMAVAAKRIIELYMASGDSFEHPALKLHAVRMLHESMAQELKQKGYSEANCFLPPSIAQKFGRRLEKTFGWVKNWSSWAKNF